MIAPSPTAALLAVLLCCTGATAGAAGQVLDPGYGPLQYQPPAAGSYQLPPLGIAADGKVLNELGDQLALHDLFDDKMVLLAFIYTHCSDINGCPLATFVMKKVQDQLAEDAGLAQQVRLISLSFDPAQDTPAALLDYAGHFRRKGFDWQFLTTASEAELLPILDGYGQWRQREYDKDGNYTGSISHILRVFLIDRQGRIRNIYSSGFLDAATVINDLHTLDIESRAATGS